MTMPEKYKNRRDGYYLRKGEELVKCDQPGYEHRWICPGCKEEGHVQGAASEFFDCKMISPDGRSQCCCYGPAHGKRRE